jgi:septal ring factor EnvC (AmiA/AmiB activator)
MARPPELRPYCKDVQRQPIGTAGLLLICSIAAATIAATIPVPGKAQDPPTAQQLQVQLETLRAEIETITATLDRQRSERDSELAQLADTERLLAARTTELRATRDALEQVEQRQQALSLEAAGLEAEVESLRQRLAEQLRVAYRVGVESRLRALLNQQDPSRISRALALHGYLGRARLDTIEQFERQRLALERVRAEQAENATELEHLAAQQGLARARQADALAQRRQALAQLEARIRDRDSELAELNRSAEQLQTLLEQLAVALADIPAEMAVTAFAELRGKLPSPLPGPVVTGYSRRDDQGTLREGWLIEAAIGDPVRAIAHGRVAYADWLRGYGMLLILDHGEGWMSLYGRNQALLAEVGDWIQPGETIALAGDSGGSGPPGLYFQIRREGRPVDPTDFIRR